MRAKGPSSARTSSTFDGKSCTVLVARPKPDHPGWVGTKNDCVRRFRLSALATVVTTALVATAGATANAATADDFPKQDPAQCTPFGNEQDARKAADAGKGVIQLWTTIFKMPEAQRLYRDYLTPGRASLARTQVVDPKAVEQFRDAKETVDAVNGIVNDLKNKLAADPPAFDTDHDLREAGLGQDVQLAWSDLETTPGFVAGGLSGVELPDKTFVPDRRDLTGNYSVTRTSSNGSAKTTLTVHGLTLKVQDSIDFCPGNLGTGMIRDVALGLSRLERTPYQDGKECGPASNCTYAKPVLFEVTVPLGDVSVDVTNVFSAK